MKTNNISKSKYNFYKYILISITILFLASCSSTKYLKNNELLLKKVDVVFVDGKKKEKEKLISDLESSILQKPNSEILGFWRLNLYLYNLTNKKIGEAPVVYDKFKIDLSVKQMQQFLHNKGYYNAKIKTIIKKRKKSKKIKIKFYITLNKPYKIGIVKHSIENLPDYFISDNLKQREISDTSLVRKIIFKDTLNSLLKSRRTFDNAKLTAEKERISNLLRNQGFYDFNKNNISFLCDTLSHKNKANIYISVSKMSEIKNDSTFYKVHKKSKIRNVYVHLEYNPKSHIEKTNQYELNLDTINYAGYKLIKKKNKGLRFKPSIITNNIFVKKGDYFKEEHTNLTTKKLTSLRQFKYVRVNYKKVNTNLNEYDLLDCTIYLTPIKKLSYKIDLVATNSAGDIGGAADLSFRHNNLFNGAEIFDISFTGSLQTINLENTNTSSLGSKDYFNTIEYGVQSKLHIHKFWLPYMSNSVFTKKYSPKTLFTLSYDFQQRPDYTRNVATFGFGYYWNTRNNYHHTFKLAELDLVRMSNIEDGFLNEINNLYVINSYKDHIILASSYNFNFNNHSKYNKVNLNFKVETAGNSFSAIHNLLKSDKIKLTENDKKDEYYEFMGIRYAQYFKSDLNLAIRNRIDRNNAIAYRMYVGFAFPYGNSQVVPFEKRFFGGGATSMRAWSVRSIGPGGYKNTSNYPNMLGDIKLELNLEYRFRLIGKLESALFLDAGNIWLWNKQEEIKNGEFEFNRFYKEIGLGTGIGFRFDLRFFMLRIDCGYKLINPVYDEEKWLLKNIKLFSPDNITFDIAYPF